jgi:hypothetical protein
MDFTTGTLNTYITLFGDFGVSFLCYGRYGFRTLSMIAAPQLAIYEPDHRLRSRDSGQTVSRPSLPSLAAFPYPLRSELKVDLTHHYAGRVSTGAFATNIPAIFTRNYSAKAQRLMPVTTVTTAKVGGPVVLGNTLALSRGL